VYVRSVKLTGMRDEIEQELNDDKLIFTLRRRGYRIDLTQEARAVWCCMVATYWKAECYRARTRTKAVHLARNAILAGKFQPSFQFDTQQEQPPCKTVMN
jgi:hypothetical protein